MPEMVASFSSRPLAGGEMSETMVVDAVPGSLLSVPSSITAAQTHSSPAAVASGVTTAASTPASPPSTVQLQLTLRSSPSGSRSSRFVTSQRSCASTRPGSGEMLTSGAAGGVFAMTSSAVNASPTSRPSRGTTLSVQVSPAAVFRLVRVSPTSS